MAKRFTAPVIPVAKQERITMVSPDSSPAVVALAVWLPSFCAAPVATLLPVAALLPQPASTPVASATVSNTLNTFFFITFSSSSIEKFICLYMSPSIADSIFDGIDQFYRTYG